MATRSLGHGVALLLGSRLGRACARRRPARIRRFGAAARQADGVRVLLGVVEEILRTLGRRAELAGTSPAISLGGLLALHAATTVPERISKVTLSAVSLPLTWGRGPRELPRAQVVRASGAAVARSPARCPLHARTRSPRCQLRQSHPVSLFLAIHGGSTPSCASACSPSRAIA